MKSRIAAAVYLLAFAALAGDYTVSNVRIRQRWPWDKKVDIDFDLVAAAPADVTFRFFDGDRELSIPSAALSGDIYGVSTGARRVVLDPEKTGYASETFLSFRAEIAASESPLYLIVDLEKDAGAEGQLTCVTKSDLDAGLYGACVTNPVAGVSSLVWTDVTNDIYKTTKLVFRRVNPGSFKTGGCGYRFSGSNWLVPSAHPAVNTAKISQPYYLGVFQLTQAQSTTLGCGNVSRNQKDGKLPAEYRTYEEFRGAAPAADWPKTGYALANNAKLKSACDKLGFLVDLPTDMQWEYACRAGTTTIWSDNVVREFETIGQSAGTVAISAAVTAFNNDVVQLARLNSTETDVVGSHVPNAWGFYDMHGNVMEWCLDWAPAGRTSATFQSAEYDTSIQMFRVDSTDYAGCASGTTRVLHGGAYNSQGYASTVAFRSSAAPSTKNGIYGARLVCFPKGVTPVVGDITPDVAE